MRIQLGNPHGMPVPLLPEDPAGGAGGGEGGGDGGAGGGANNGGTDEKKFSQAELDRHIAERLRRAVPSDYEDVKAKAKKLDELEQANASDIEKATTKARQEAAAEVRAELMGERVLDRAEILAAGTWADTRDARLRLRDRTAEFVDKNGQINADAIKAALADELKAAPHLSTKQTGRPLVDGAQGAPDAGNGTPGAGGLAAAARRFGKPGSA
jgi:hypothetical protein